MGAWESKRWEPKRIGDGAVDNKGGAQGKPRRRGDGNPPQESGAEGDRRKKEIKTNAGNRHH